MSAEYNEIPAEIRAKAKPFFDRAATVAGTGNFDYGIEMYLQGLSLDPESIEAHQALRDVALKRRVSGGKDLGFMQKMQVKTNSKDDKANMLGAEKLLAYDPGGLDHMQTLMQSALKGGFYETTTWIMHILFRANAEAAGGKEDLKKHLAVKDAAKAVRDWGLAVQACQHAYALRPNDMDLAKELKDLGAAQTMDVGGYGGNKGFRGSIRNKDQQAANIESQKDVQSVDFMKQAVVDAKKAMEADPNEGGKVMKYVDALLKSGDKNDETVAVEVLQNAYTSTGTYRFKTALGKIRLQQLRGQERTLRAAVAKAPQDAEAAESYREFEKVRAEEEYEIFREAGEHYPTDMSLKFEQSTRLYTLTRYDEAIPLLQQAVQDPKFRNHASLYLGRAFLSAQFVDEAADTFKGLIDSYDIKGDDFSKDMYYWYGRSLEEKGDTTTSLGAYSQVVKWDFNYRDVQSRIKRLRTGAK